MIKIKQFVFNHFDENTYIVWDESKECAIIDPGMNSDVENDKLSRFIADNQLVPKKVLLTHAHIDHVAGLRYVCETYKLPVTMHADGQAFLGQAEVYGSAMGFGTKDMNDLDTEYINDNATINFGNSVLKAGSMAFVADSPKVVFTGDVLFRQSIGRTDLPTGDYDVLMKMLNTKVLVLDNECEVLPGHGPNTTIGDEKNFNPFLM